MRTYSYTNNLGIMKIINISRRSNDTFDFSLWDTSTGDCTGGGTMTKAEFTEFKEHYSDFQLIKDDEVITND